MKGTYLHQYLGQRQNQAKKNTRIIIAKYLNYKNLYETLSSVSLITTLLYKLGVQTTNENHENYLIKMYTGCPMWIIFYAD